MKKADRKARYLKIYKLMKGGNSEEARHELLSMMGEDTNLFIFEKTPNPADKID